MDGQLPSPIVSDISSLQEPMPKGLSLLSLPNVNLAAHLLAVKIHLSDVSAQEPFPDRVLTLTAPEWSIKVGRGSQSEPDLVPAPDNAWFASRVMSRHHAIIQADPTERTVTIQDVGSMHGTSISGTKVRQEQREIILDDDVVTFGAEVVRGPEKYQPLRLLVSYSWSDDAVDISVSQFSRQPSRNSTNRFTADYSDDEDCRSIANSDDIEVVRESVRQASVEFLSAKPSSPVLSSPKSLDSPVSEKHPSSITEPTDISDTEQADFKKKVAVDVVSIPSMLNPHSTHEDREYSDPHEEEDTFSKEHMFEDEIDDDDFEEDACDEDDEDDEDDLNSEYPDAYEPSPANASIKDQVVPDSAEQVIATFVPAEEILPRDPSPSDAALPKATSLQQSKATPYVAATTWQPPQFPPSQLPPPPSVSFPRVSRTIYNTVNSQPSYVTSSSLSGMPYSATPVNGGYGVNNTWIDQYPMCNSYTTPAHSLMGTNSNLPRFEANLNSSHFPPLVFDSSTTTDPYANNKLARKRTIDDVYNNSNEKHAGTASDCRGEDVQSESPPLSYSGFPAYSDGQQPHIPEFRIFDGPATVSAITSKEVAATAEGLADASLYDTAPKRHDGSRGSTELLPDQPCTDIEERAHKRRKTQTEVIQPSNNGSGFVKYAATALAGAAIGAVGTVLGLAALPVDFFA